MVRRIIAVLALALLTSAPLEALAQAAAASAYAPVKTTCPHESLVRSAGTNQKLSPGEVDYVTKRTADVLPQAWHTYLANVEAYTSGHSITLPSYVSSILGGSKEAFGMKMGIATSGGGYRAAIFGAGVLNAFDGRNRTSAQSGVGGLLQSATYLSGLSGGSWLVSSLSQANFPPLAEVVFGSLATNSTAEADVFGGWQTNIDLLQVSSDTSVETQYVELLLQELGGKYKAGFPVTITDIWARTLARHFVNGTTWANFFNADNAHGAGKLWSGITQV